MSIIFDAFRKVEIKNAPDLLAKLSSPKKPAGSDSDSLEDEIHAAGPGEIPPKRTLNRRSVKKMVSSMEEKPTWVLGLALGSSLIFLVVVMVSLISTPAAEDRKEAPLDMSALSGYPASLNAGQSVYPHASPRGWRSDVRPSGRPPLDQTSSRPASFSTHPLLWSSAHPRETISSIKGTLADLLAQTDQKESWTARQFRVSGLFVEEGGERLVIINGKLLRVGDRIRGARVSEINPHEIKLDMLGQVITLNVS